MFLKLLYIIAGILVSLPVLVLYLHLMWNHEKYIKFIKTKLNAMLFRIYIIYDPKFGEIKFYNINFSDISLSTL